MRVLGLDPGLRITGYGCVETGDDRGSRARSGYGATQTARGYRYRSGNGDSARCEDSCDQRIEFFVSRR